ncbi:unnamed protein product [Linum trigynum]|uniref:PB1 domain-containing protein n=1 Tax=Linum trigynum TaxID=586398 RepID=A0AAV2EVW1_9ROSI
MDPQPQPPSSAPPLSSVPASTPSSAAPPTSGVLSHLVTTTAPAASYPDSIDSSPRSRTTESFNDEPPPLSSKLRLMCSYGGRIVPRPHDKSLCYVGGDTRIVVVDRQASLSGLSAKLSTTLLNGRPFTLKYQLPSEDLDSLISVTTDEDLDNMIDEYDRTFTGASSKPSRLRLFLFPTKPDSSQSIGPILENSAAKDEWFLNALNGATAGLLNRGFSDSASVNCLLGLDDDPNNHLDLVGVGRGGEARDGEGSNKNAKQGQDVHSVPDSPMLETTSSFGSTSSSPSLANLPPIRVHVDDGGGVRGVGLDQQKVGIEEQFAQISVGSGGGQKPDEGFMIISSPPPMPVSITVSGVPVGSPVMGGGYQNRIISDDERSDHGVPVEYRRPPPPQSQPQMPPPQSQQQGSTGGGGSGSGGANDLLSPDSMSSDSSFSNAMNRQQQKPGISQEQQVMQIPHGANRVVASNLVDPNTSSVQVQQQLQDSGNLLLAQFEQQQHQQQQPHYIHAGGHYIQHHPSGAVQLPAYYPVYPQQQQHIHQMDHHQQYPVYYVQARQPQAYNLQSVQQPQSSVGEPANNGGRSQTPPTIPPMVPQSAAAPAAYNPVRNAPVPKPEMMYRTTNNGTPQLIALSSPGQQQYVGFSQVHHHPSQSMAPAAASAGTPSYGYEFVDPSHGHGPGPIYYTQPLAPSIPASQYQTMTTGGGGVVLAEGSVQIPAEPIMQQQQQRTTQPL